MHTPHTQILECSLISHMHCNPAFMLVCIQPLHVCFVRVSSWCPPDVDSGGEWVPCCRYGFRWECRCRGWLPKKLCAEKSYMFVGYPAWDRSTIAEQAALVAACPVVSVLLMGSCVECVKNMKERRCGMSTHEH